MRAGIKPRNIFAINGFDSCASLISGYNSVNLSGDTMSWTALNRGVETVRNLNFGLLRCRIRAKRYSRQGDCVEEIYNCQEAEKAVAQS